MFKLQVLVSIQRDNVTNMTVECVVFIMMYFHSHKVFAFPPVGGRQQQQAAAFC